MLPIHSGARDQVVELDPEHDLLIGVELGCELLRHLTEVVLFLKGVPKKEAEFGINGLWKIVAQKSEG